jgi:uncharacterized membrane protein
LRLLITLQGIVAQIQTLPSLESIFMSYFPVLIAAFFEAAIAREGITLKDFFFYKSRRRHKNTTRIPNLTGWCWKLALVSVPRVEIVFYPQRTSRIKLHTGVIPGSQDFLVGRYLEFH